jgi:hypothetical protein
MPAGKRGRQWAVRPIFESDIAQDEEAGDGLEAGVAVVDERLALAMSAAPVEVAVTEPGLDGRGAGAAGVLADHGRFPLQLRVGHVECALVTPQNRHVQTCGFSLMRRPVS